MNTRALIVVVVSILVACSHDPKKGPEELKLQRDAFASALAIQMHAVNYKADITTEGETVNIRVGQASVSDIRRAICRQMGWPSSEGKMIRMADTLRLLHLNGITKIKIISNPEKLDVELEYDGRCWKAS